MSLTEYNQKRHFNQTPEPEGKEANSKGALRFVVHRHQASKLHYDFRLELEGVLKSWAVPKGPSLNPSDKRLAVAVEDHPVSYSTFEGDIPEGNYGAGHVDIWDQGTFHAVGTLDRAEGEQQMLQELEAGSLHFVLEGQKLRGEFSLVKMKGRQEDAWLLLKKKDEDATDAPYDAEDFVDEPATKSTKPASAKTKEKPKASAKKAESKTGSAEMPHDIVPMTAKLTDGPFDDENWLFEVKWDGYRAVAEVENGKVQLYSRNGKSFKEKYGPVVKALESLPHQAVFDGELVILDQNGKADFQALQNYQNTPSEHLYYYIFDLLYLDGQDLRDFPLVQRKEKLAAVLSKAKNPLRYSEHRVGKGTKFFKEAQENEWEGIMAKAAQSKYLMGKRSQEWLKIKTHLRQEAIIAGYTQPQGSRVHIGALVLGVYEGKELKYVGQSGSGFNKQSLQELIEKLEPLKQEKSPFKEKVPLSREVTWVKPELVCELAFAEWTADGQMRQAIFKGLRVDKKAKDVVHEQIVSAPETPQQTTSQKSTKKPKMAAKQEKDEDTLVLELDGQQISISHPDKLYWPEEGITKKDLVMYYQTMADVLLLYLKDRPESLLRHPNGITKPGFFQKDAGDNAPDWLQTTTIKAESTGKDVDYLVCQNKAALAYLNNLGCIQLNPWNSRLQHLDTPDYLVLDLDPGENTYDEVVETALAAKEILDELGIPVYAKTSGATGMHLYVPLAAKWPFEQVKELAHLLAQRLQDRLPKLTSLERSPKERRNQIYIDFLQNAIAQTIAAPYCVRPRAGATVSTPLLWEEVKTGLHPSQFTMKNVPDRVQKLGDLFKPVLGEGIDVAAYLKKLKK
ncbi:DNA ligase D [Rufibacter aurantiacus]|uniref:DNA ligase D n=1 Tax=Rufibacter aurantiacus TaxID=2817374 RepID=UPI001B30C4E7|nr:DNA ligase D [Rufibacter aurantiacus]